MYNYNMKKFVKFSIIYFLISGFIFLIGKQEWFPDFYNPIFVGVMSFISALLIALPALLGKYFFIKDRSLTEHFQAITAFTLILSSFGTLGLFQLYKVGFQYDKLVHFIVPFLFTIEAIKIFNSKNGFIAKLIIAGLTIMMAGVAWELLEFLSDMIFKTKTWGIYGMNKWSDTKIDIVFNTFGILSALTYSWFKKNNGKKD